MDTVKLALAEVSQVPVGTNKERPLRTSEFVAEQINDRYSREIANTLQKPESMYSYDRSEVFIR